MTIMCAYGIFLFAIWTCLSRRYDDGIFGKIVFCFSALVALSLIIQPDNETAQTLLNLAFFMVCCRSFIRHTFYPFIFKKYPELDRRNNGKRAAKSPSDCTSDHPII